MPNKIFINYRRSDTSAQAQNLHMALSKEFGKRAVFLDVHDIRAGSNWVDTLKKSGSAAKVVLVLMGQEWLTTGEDGRPRLFNENDWVRREIETAFNYNLVAIPVLFDQARMPSNTDLPQSLQPLTQRNAISIRHDSFSDDVRRLIREIEPHVDSSLKRFYKRYRTILLTLLFAALVIGGYAVFRACSTAPEPCPPFDEDKEIKTLIISPKNMARSVIAHVDEQFREKCKSRFRNQNMPYRAKNTENVGALHNRAKSCGADVFIIPKSNSISTLEVEFGYANPMLEQFYIDNSNNLTARNDSIRYGDGHSSFTAELDEAICLIASFVMKQKGRIENVAGDLMQCTYSIKNWRTRVFALNLMADSYIAQNKLDSAIMCLAYSDTINWQKESRMEKIAVLAKNANEHHVAIEYYTKLMALDTDNKYKYQEHRGDQYREVKDYKNAKADYKDVKEAQPNNGAVIDKYRAVESDIQVNNSFINANISNINNLSVATEVANRLNENGDYTRAQRLLDRIRTTAPNDLRIRALEVESRLQTGTINPNSISSEIIRVNPRISSHLSRRIE